MIKSHYCARIIAIHVKTGNDRGCDTIPQLNNQYITIITYTLKCLQKSTAHVANMTLYNAVAIAAYCHNNYTADHKHACVLMQPTITTTTIASVKANARAHTIQYKIKSVGVLSMVGFVVVMTTVL